MSGFRQDVKVLWNEFIIEIFKVLKIWLLRRPRGLGEPNRSPKSPWTPITLSRFKGTLSP